MLKDQIEDSNAELQTLKQLYQNVKSQNVSFIVYTYVITYYYM